MDRLKITGIYGNWSGNDTLNVRTPDRENIGGLSGEESGLDFGPPFDVDDVSAFTGEISRALLWSGSSFTPWPSRTDLQSGLNPNDALYDSDARGFATDDGNGPASSSNQSGVPLIDDSSTRRHSSGFTFDITFTPSSADLQGTRLIIELGAYISGTGLYLVDGVPTLVGKQNSADNQVPASLNDTALPAIAVQSSIGVLKAGIPYAFSAAWDHNGNLELKVSENLGFPILNRFRITGTYGNWSGNDTLNVRTPHRANLGGLSGSGSGLNYGSPFDVDIVSAFTGEINRALLWNEYPTAPSILGFSATALPTQGKVRLHWNISAGFREDLAPRVTIRDASGEVAYSAEVTNGTGFHDAQTHQTNFTLVVSNSTGESLPATAVLETRTTFASAIHQDKPVLWYRFNESDGAAWAADSAENASPLDGLATRAAVSKGTGPLDGAAVFGSSSIQTDLVFDPSGFSDRKPHGGFSIEALVRLSADHNELTALISQKDVNGTGRNILGVQADGTLFTFLGGQTYRFSTTALEKGRWTHIVLVVDAGADEVRWYVDGVPAGRNTGAPLGIESSQGGWVIGSNKNLGTPFKGLVDEVAVYDTLLDDPDSDGDPIDSRVMVHRDAWWNEVTQASVSPDPVHPGNAATLTLELTNGISSVEVDGNPASIADGKAVIVLTPGQTTTYRISLRGDYGTVVREITVTVKDSPQGDTSLRIQETSVEGQDFILKFHGTANTEYQVTGSPDLTSFDEPIHTVRTDAEGTATVRIPISPGLTKRFFRVGTITD